MVKPAFQAVQDQFTAHMRDPDSHAGPDDVEDRRLKIYRDLLYKNVEGFMANAYPVLRQITDDSRWHTMIRHYFANHRATTPMFPKMAQEFLHYLQHERDVDGDPVFMGELAHYEWLEAEVTLDTQELSEVPIDPQASLLDGIPVVNPVIRPYAYHFPVHRIGPEFQPDAPPETPTYLVVFRHRNDEAGFMELNAVSARLLELMIENDTRTGSALLSQIAAELQHPDPKVIEQAGAEMLKGFVEKDILLGARLAGA